MTPHSSDPDPAPADRQPPADAEAGHPADSTEPLPSYSSADNPTLPLPPYTAAGPQGKPGAASGDSSGAAYGSTYGSPSGPRPAPGTGAQARSNGFFSWLRSLRIVRGDDRWLGGVCSGVAARTGLDPVLVRGLFIVLGLLGGGLLLYGLAWALLPEPDGRIHAEEAVHGSWTSGTTGALAAIILGAGSPGIFWAGDGLLGGFFWTLFWVVGVGLVLYWLFTRSGARTPPAEAAGSGPLPGTAAHAGQAPSGTYPAPTAPFQRAYDASAPSRSPYQPAPGTYPPPSPPPSGPYASAGPTASAGRMPDHPRTPVKAARIQPRTTPAAAEVAVVLGAALLVLGTVLTLDYASVIDLEAPVATALAAAAVATGLGIVVLGALGRSSGVLGLAAIAALIGAGVAGTSPGAYGTVVVANQSHWTPSASQAATDGYTLAAADGNLDLRYLADMNNYAVEVPVSLAASDLTILVPDNIPVVVRADMFAGNVQIDNGVTLTESGGLWKASDVRVNDVAGEPLVVRVKGVASNVLVTVNESDLD